MREVFGQSFAGELNRLAFDEAFTDELSKVGEEKKAFIPLIPLILGAGLLTAGATGLAAVTRPKNVPWSRWMGWKGVKRTAGHLGGLATMLYGGGLAGRGAGLLGKVGPMGKALGVGVAAERAGLAPRFGTSPGAIRYAPKPISELPYEQPVGAF